MQDKGHFCWYLAILDNLSSTLNDLKLHNFYKN